MDKLASRLNKAVTRAGGGINNMIATKALKELGWTHELADQVEVLKRELVEEKRSRELAVAKAWEFADRIKRLETVLRDVIAVAEAEYCTLTDGEHGSLFKWHEPFQRAHKLLEASDD